MANGDDALSGAWNFRDIAKHTDIRPGWFFRASELSGLDDAGRATLAGLGVADVADLRSDREVERRGADGVSKDVAIHRLPFRELGTDAPHEQAFEQAMTAGDGDVAAVARQYMTDEYVRYPGLAGAQAAVRQMISLLADGRPMLTHCFAGKDRTGFTVAVTLRTAGVDNHAVMTDYLESNAAVPALRDRILESLRKRDDQQTAEIEAFADARLAEEVLGVREVYLEAAFRVLDEEYGSLPEYLRAVGVTDEQVSRLRGNLR